MQTTRIIHFEGTGLRLAGVCRQSQRTRQPRHKILGYPLRPFICLVLREDFILAQ
jgi:hypothetical protein